MFFSKLDVMHVLDHVRIIVYRFHEKGLEVLMSQDLGCLVDGDYQKLEAYAKDKQIELESIQDENGNTVRVMAVEGDWHDIPSIRALIKNDVKMVKGKIKEMVPELENGVYMAIKEAFKKTLPHEYAALKELKDILFDRNLITNI